MIQRVRSSTLEPVFKTGLEVTSGNINFQTGTTLSQNCQTSRTGLNTVSSGVQVDTAVQLTFSPTLIVDCANRDYYEVDVMTSNVVAFVLNNFQAGRTLRFVFKQDATGSRTIVPPLGYKISGALNATANSYSILELYKPTKATYAVLGLWKSYPA